eukprot:TRINITY_DN10920_c2_g1_i2.p1 TRINITY_DN10920_c2_g1~~TRINITY_DN10920_c2_g1_i2.p1  ORF type:complete len:281 (+),score=37.76 TRINITY_DN10920_c2_g1_i2:316-1158(+)
MFQEPGCKQQEVGQVAHWQSLLSQRNVVLKSQLQRLCQYHNQFKKADSTKAESMAANICKLCSQLQLNEVVIEGLRAKEQVKIEDQIYDNRLFNEKSPGDWYHEADELLQQGFVQADLSNARHSYQNADLYDRFSDSRIEEEKGLVEGVKMYMPKKEAEVYALMKQFEQEIMRQLTDSQDFNTSSTPSDANMEKIRDFLTPSSPEQNISSSPRGVTSPPPESSASHCETFATPRPRRRGVSLNPSGGIQEEEQFYYLDSVQQSFLLNGQLPCSYGNRCEC